MKKSPHCAPLPRQAGADGVLLMTSDPHCSEYLPDYYNALPMVLRLYRRELDLRGQPARQRPVVRWPFLRFRLTSSLAGTEIRCMHAGSAGVPTVADYLTANFAAGETLLLDGMLRACPPWRKNTPPPWPRAELPSRARTWPAPSGMPPASASRCPTPPASC